MNKINEKEFKSIPNSNNVDGLDWCVISMKITKRPITFDYPTRWCYCREIAYINKDNKVYQIGRLFVPTNRIKYFIFFIRLTFSRKTFGHFVTEYFPGQFDFNVIESSKPLKRYNILFNPNALIRYSKRVIEIKNTNYKFYVEEEFEVI